MKITNDPINESSDGSRFDPTPLPLPQFLCTGSEVQGNVELLNDDGTLHNTVLGSRCFADWFCAFMPFTWRWRDGIDPDDPGTWPPGAEPVTPAAEAQEPE